MAYLNEFPNWEADGKNLDWLLQQYSTFNERLQAVVDEFHETVQQMETDISNLETDYQRKLDLFESRINTEVQTISNAIEQVSTHVVEYVRENMTQWQINASRLTVPVSDYSGTGVIPDILASEHDIIILDCFYAYRDNDNILWRYIQKMDVVNVYIGTDNHYHINLVTPIDTATFYVHYSII